MKNLEEKIIPILQENSCTPQISKLAKKLKEPSTTIHYNIKKLEQTKKVIGYKAVLNHELIGDGFCAFVLLTLSPDEYGNPERIAKSLAIHKNVESVDIITGDWELVIKVRAKNQAEYYEFVKKVISRKGIEKIKTLISLKQEKSEFFQLNT
ncbi:MAG: Lrp/AsnC family transcriptional regulator [Candidatus Woesearchaeota archaeon]|jgi:DNA-binding Lrp family transcriptional regulator